MIGLAVTVPACSSWVFQKTLLPGLPAGERDPSLAPDDGRTGWHFSFLSLLNLPELLLAGRERPFWTYFARRQMWDPSAPSCASHVARTASSGLQ